MHLDAGKTIRCDLRAVGPIKSDSLAWCYDKQLIVGSDVVEHRLVGNSRSDPRADLLGKGPLRQDVFNAELLATLTGAICRHTDLCVRVGLQLVAPYPAYGWCITWSLKRDAVDAGTVRIARTAHANFHTAPHETDIN